MGGLADLKTQADKMPTEHDYGYFILHLEERKASSNLLHGNEAYGHMEEVVMEQLETGSVKWLPKERCLHQAYADATEVGQSERLDKVRCPTKHTLQKTPRSLY